jgi:hypothetical protein
MESEFRQSAFDQKEFNAFFWQQTRFGLDMSRPRDNKRRRPVAGAKGGNGRTVCALCGSTITETSPDQPVIYSICVTCKKLPHRNPGSTASFN